MGNIIMTFAFVVAVLTLIFGGNFLWQNGAGLRFYNRYKSEISKDFKDSILDFQKRMVSTYIEMGSLFFNSHNKSNKESLYQFNLALNYVLALEPEKQFLVLYKSIVDGIEKNSDASDLNMLPVLSRNLNNLVDKVKDMDEELSERIKGLIDNLESDKSEDCVAPPGDHKYSEEEPVEDSSEESSENGENTSASETPTEEKKDNGGVSAAQDDVNSNPESENAEKCSGENAVKDRSEENPENGNSISVPKASTEEENKKRSAENKDNEEASAEQGNETDNHKMEKME